MMLAPAALKAIVDQISAQIEADRARAEQLNAELRAVFDRISSACEAKTACMQLLAALAKPGTDLPESYSQDPASAAAQIVPSAGALAALGKAAIDAKSNPAPREKTSPQVADAQDAGAPEGLAAPRPAAPAAGAGRTRAPAVSKCTNWSPAKDAQLLQLRRDGKTNSEAAAVLGCTPRAIDNRLSKLRKVKTPAPAVVSDGVSDGCDAPRRDVRAALARVEALGWSGGWTPEMDLALLEGLTKGSKLVELANQIGMGRQDARVRFAALVPQPSFEAQTAMIDALRRIVEAAT